MCDALFMRRRCLSKHRQLATSAASFRLQFSSSSTRKTRRFFSSNEIDSVAYPMFFFVKRDKKRDSCRRYRVSARLIRPFVTQLGHRILTSHLTNERTKHQTGDRKQHRQVSFYLIRCRDVRAVFTPTITLCTLLN